MTKRSREKILQILDDPAVARVVIDVPGVPGRLRFSYAGLFLIWRVTTNRGLLISAWRGVTLFLALLLIADVIGMAADLEELTDLFAAVASVIVPPIWALMTARQLAPTFGGDGHVVESLRISKFLVATRTLRPSET